MTEKSRDSLERSDSHSHSHSQKPSMLLLQRGESRIRQTYVVDPNYGMFKTIQEAIDAVEPHSIIRVCAGLYHENLIIDKPLRIEPQDRNGDVIIVASSKPTVYISVDPIFKVNLIHLKLAHKGKNEALEKFQNQGNEDASALVNLFGGSREDPEDEKDDENPLRQLIRRFQIDKEMHSLVFLQSGQCQMEHCSLALSFLDKNNKEIIPAIVQCPGTKLSLEKSLLSGHEKHQTIGVFNRKGILDIIDTRIQYFKNGGVMIDGQSGQNCKILHSKILCNGGHGVHLIGDDVELLLEYSEIIENGGDGVKIESGTRLTAVDNTIKLNRKRGVEALGGKSKIIKNRIDKNYSDGIYSTNFKNPKDQSVTTGEAVIQNNEISSNKGNGIFITGEDHTAQISENSFIAYNQLAGIRIDHFATAKISENSVLKNAQEGVLLVETAQAEIVKNVVMENLRANIAYGGENSENTTIIENTISHGRCEGIYVVKSLGSTIERNDIFENNYGIVVQNSSPNVSKNAIYKNKSDGLLIFEECKPSVIDNVIRDNQGIGLYIREFVTGTFRDNKIHGNEIDLVLDKREKDLSTIKFENEVRGTAILPNRRCTIF